MKKILSLAIVLTMIFALGVPVMAKQPTSATLTNGDDTLSVHVNQQKGNTNDLIVTINGEEHKIVINNNAAGTYEVDGYVIYVDTKGNDQIRSFEIISAPEVGCPEDCSCADCLFIVGVRVDTITDITDYEDDVTFERTTGSNGGNFVKVIITETGKVIVKTYDVWNNGNETINEDLSSITNYENVVVEETIRLPNGNSDETYTFGEYEIMIIVQGNQMRDYRVVTSPDFDDDDYYIVDEGEIEYFGDDDEDDDEADDE